MVKIRLARMGRIHKPIYKIVAADARSPRDGLGGGGGGRRRTEVSVSSGGMV